MSAYIVDNNHIHYLIEAAKHYRLTVWHDSKRHNLDAAEWGDELARQNGLSFNHRYSKEEEPSYAYMPERYTWPDFRTFDVLKACDCLGYQSCEHPGWEQSFAFAILDSLRSAAWHAAPEYDRAEWGAPARIRHTRPNHSQIAIVGRG